MTDVTALWRAYRYPVIRSLHVFTVGVSAGLMVAASVAATLYDPGVAARTIPAEALIVRLFELLLLTGGGVIVTGVAVYLLLFHAGGGDGDEF